MRNLIMRSMVMAAAAMGIVWLTAGIADAHGDTLDGPVVKAAQSAPNEGNVRLVLPWVQKNDEAEIRAAFSHTMEVRKLGVEARKLADNYFFETLVRIHRGGEGAPYTGLKPAGRDLGHALIASDKAREPRDGTELLALKADAVRKGIEKRFREVVALSDYKTGDIETGRRYVAAYVEYVHYVEGIHNAAAGQAEHHTEAAAAEEQHVDSAR